MMDYQAVFVFYKLHKHKNRFIGYKAFIRAELLDETWLDRIAQDFYYDMERKVLKNDSKKFHFCFGKIRDKRNHLKSIDKSFVYTRQFTPECSLLDDKFTKIDELIVNNKMKSFIKEILQKPIDKLKTRLLYLTPDDEEINQEDDELKSVLNLNLVNQHQLESNMVFIEEKIGGVTNIKTKPILNLSDEIRRNLVFLELIGYLQHGKYFIRENKAILFEKFCWAYGDIIINRSTSRSCSKHGLEYNITRLCKDELS